MEGVFLHLRFVIILSKMYDFLGPQQTVNVLTAESEGRRSADTTGVWSGEFGASMHFAKLL